MTIRRLLALRRLVAGTQLAFVAFAGATGSGNFASAGRRVMSGFKRAIALMVVTMTALVVAACGDDGGADGGVAASGMIGPAGGTVASVDGRIALTIPAGALGNATEIRIIEVTGDAIPARLRSPLTEKLYLLEPSGTRFAAAARATVRLPRGAPGDWVAMALDSNGAAEVPREQSIDELEDALVLEADVAHFSYLVINRVPGAAGQATPTPNPANVGETVRIDLVISGTFDEALQLTYDGATDTDYRRPLAFLRFGEQPPNRTFGGGQYTESRGHEFAVCVAAGIGTARFNYIMYSLVAAAFYFPYLSVGVEEVRTTRYIYARVECRAASVSAPPVVSTGLFNIPGLTAPDGINYFAGPFATLSGTGPYAAIAGAEGVVVLDLVTRQVVLDRTATGPDGATLGVNALGVLPVAHEASVGAEAALVGFGNGGGFVQNYDASVGWGGTARDAEPTFDAVAVGGGLVADSVAMVRPVLGVELLEWDPAARAYRAAQAKFAPLSLFPGGGQLVSAQIPDVTAGGVLVLSRATSASISTSTKVFFKNVGDALPAVTLLSLGNRDARRLRCIPVDTKQACVATMFGGQGLAFLFDPATPRVTPRVTTLPAAAGTLGVAQALLPNGRVAVAMANFTANSLTVAELSADLVTVHSSSTIPAPTGCTGTAHVALATDSEGLKAIVTCNGTNNYWVARMSP